MGKPPLRGIGPTVVRAQHRAACHCGAVVLERNLPEGRHDVRPCDCSMCRRKAAVMGAVPLAALRVTKGAEVLSVYRCNTLTAEHYFCSRCGIYSHHRRRSQPSQFGFNSGCLGGFDPNEVTDVALSDGVNHPADRQVR